MKLSNLVRAVIFHHYMLQYHILMRYSNHNFFYHAYHESIEPLYLVGRTFYVPNG